MEGGPGSAGSVGSLILAVACLSRVRISRVLAIVTHLDWIVSRAE